MKRLLVALVFAASPAIAETQSRPVVSEIVAADVASHRAFTGLIDPRTETALAFRTNGRVAQMLVETGDRVSQGDLLAELDQITLQQDLRAAEAAVASAQAVDDLASRQKDRAVELNDRGVYSEAQLEAVQANADAAAAQLESAEATLRQAQEAARYSQLLAPYDGIVLSMNVDAGTTISAGMPILTLSDFSGLDAIIDVPTAIYDLMPPNLSFSIQHHSKDIAPVTATLRLVDPVTEGRLDTRRLHLSLIDPPTDYRIGALVTATPFEASVNFATLPLSALFTQDDQFGVWVVDPSDRSVHFTPVDVGAEIDGRVVITGGAQTGDEIITRGVHALEEGQKVGDRIQ